MSTPRISVAGLCKEFVGEHRTVRAVNGVSLDLAAGRSLALVGESGSGKTTVGRCILRLIEPTQGVVRHEGTDLGALDRESLRAMRSRLQMVFQDPRDTVNPRMRISEVVGEPLVIHSDLSRKGREERVIEALEQVQLGAEFMDRYPKSLSGGQLQRIGIARALITSPDFVVLDEPTSALDQSVRRDVLDLLYSLRDQFGISYLHISHDLAGVGEYADDIAVMYAGVIVEEGPSAAVLTQPQHPYTQALLSAVLTTEGRARDRIVLPGEPPRSGRPSVGCPFAARCPIAIQRCRDEDQALAAPGADSQRAACWRVADGSNLISSGSGSI